MPDVSVAQALAVVNNEPLNWLLGDSLRSWSSVPPGHFLLGALSEPRTGTLVAWNAWIHRFRELLLNPDAAPLKAAADLRSDGSDIDTKLRGLAAEIHAVLTLALLGFTDFEIVTAGSQASPDFLATFESQRSRIEVKNLREPADYVRMVAAAQWALRRREKPQRYSFDVALRHEHRGPLSISAEQRLRSIVDQLPETSRSWTETLDGGVVVTFERIAPSSGDIPVYANLLRPGSPGHLVVVTTVMAQHFDFDPSELQALFLKSIRVVAEAQRKSFGRGTSDPDVLNVFAIRWESPEVLFDPGLMREVETRIGDLYSAFGLRLKVVLFPGSGPEMPWELLNRYR